MKKYLLLLFFILSFYSSSIYSSNAQTVPFSTNETHLTIWNGTQYIPFFMKGVNLGIAIPGTFPGELAASREQYAQWFTQVKEAGFNCIRLYTLHYPRFYEVLDSFNIANSKSPLFFIQGVWLEEEIPGGKPDLTVITEAFNNEIEENVDCVHGNRVIDERRGKAFGTFSKDVSAWCMAYIIGREIHPIEVHATNENHPTLTSFSGNHFSIQGVAASEVWSTARLNHLLSYESQNYNTQRPVSMSSWPTLDPLHHPEEVFRDEDSASIDLSEIVVKNAPAGFFLSYHAYPYYPDFISRQTEYLEYFDDYGPNSYWGYLEDLKSHYPKYPLIIAEFGVPSSWGVAKYATSGMNHGGHEEDEQGRTILRMLETIKNANCGGGISFSWIDEWFKRTWITDPMDRNPEGRLLWHNITAAEQNFGLVSFRKKTNLELLIDESDNIKSIKGDANYDFFELEIKLNNLMDVPDEMWVALDTYSDDLGESKMPNGETIPFRSEFLLHITSFSAHLYVTEAYDAFQMWYNLPSETQKFRSTATDGAPWKIVRWKNNTGTADVQYIGKLQVNYSFQTPSSHDAITIDSTQVNVRIPWTLLNVMEPNQLKVLHDGPTTPEREDTITDGFNLGLFYKNKWYKTQERFKWESWNTIPKSTLITKPKTSYYIMKEGLTKFNTPAIAMRDSFTFINKQYPVNITAVDGVLKNDFDLDGNLMIALITEPATKGFAELYSDGSFKYSPYKNFNDIDSLKYCIYDGYSLSEPNTVVFNVKGATGIDDDPYSDSSYDLIVVYPNPTSSVVNIKTKIAFKNLMLFDSTGRMVYKIKYGKRSTELDISSLPNGTYILVGEAHDKFISTKILKQ